MILRKLFIEDDKQNAICFRNSLNDIFDGIIPNIITRTFIKCGYDCGVFLYVVEIKIEYKHSALLIPFDMQVV